MIDLRYLAGFIDGEGWIGIYKSNSNGKLQKSDRFTLQVGIGQTLKGQKLFEDLVKQFGGHMSFYQPKSQNSKPQCKFVVVSDNAMNLLIQVEPFLILKKEQALIGIEFQKGVSTRNKKLLNTKRVLLSEEITEKRREYYNRMKILNKKGIDEPATSVN